MSMLIFYREACILSNESLQLQKKQPTLRTKMTKNNKSNSTRAQSGHRKRVVSPAQVAQDADPEERSRRERNKLEKRDRIRQAAWELFISQGFDSTTTRQVATRAGVAAGMQVQCTEEIRHPRPDLSSLPTLRLARRGERTRRE